MKLGVLEKTERKLILEVRGESHTFVNLLRENAWKKGAEQASYIIENPFMSEPKFLLIAKNPKKVLTDSAQLIIDQAKELQNELKRVFKK